MNLSVVEIFKVGIGPSGSHTMGPMNAARRFVLDLQGRGHGTDRAVLLGLEGLDPCCADPDHLDPALARIRNERRRAQGRLPGSLAPRRRAPRLCRQRLGAPASHPMQAMDRLNACAMAVNEENAAEIRMEHHLGLICDPVAGLVQIPCIERNAMGAVKAVNAARLALRGDGVHQVSHDQVIATLRQSGEDMATIYKETSQGGLAVNVPEC